MATKYNEHEIKAMLEKEENPTNSIICPRCGKLLVYTEIGNSHKVECQTKDCLVSRCRGL